MKFIFAFMLVVFETVGGCLHVYGQTRDTLNVADSVVYDTVAIETSTSEISTTDYKFKPKRLILPASLVAVGAFGVCNGWMKYW